MSMRVNHALHLQENISIDTSVCQHAMHNKILRKWCVFVVQVSYKYSYLKLETGAQQYAQTKDNIATGWFRLNAQNCVPD